MDRSSNFFSYSVHEEGEDSYQKFDEYHHGNRHIPQQSFASMPFQEASPASMGQPFRPIQPVPGTQLSMASRAHLSLEDDDDSFAAEVQKQSQLLAVPGFDRLQLGSPGLSSGTPTTPDTTRSFGQNATPKEMLAHADSSQQSVFSAMFPPPAPASAPVEPKRRRSRKPRIKPELTPAEEEEKRNKFLARNRVAATRCREKRKGWMVELEETRFGLENRHSHLQKEYNGLLAEVSQIRTQLMAHASCNDPNIDKWIENEAKRFVIGTGERYDAMLTNFGLLDPVQQPGHENTSSISGYTTSTANNFMAPATPQGGISFPQPVTPSSNVFMHRRTPNDTMGGYVVTIESSYDPGSSGGGDSSAFKNSYFPA